MHPTPIIRMVSAKEAKSRFDEIIQRGYTQDEHLIVENGDIPVVAIIPMADYQQLLNTSTAEAEVVRPVASASRREAANRQLGKVLARVHARQYDVDENAAEKLILGETMAVKRARVKRVSPLVPARDVWRRARYGGEAHASCFAQQALAMHQAGTASERALRAL